MVKAKKWKYGFDHTTADGQKRLMDISMGRDSESHITRPINIAAPGDHGCDPLGGGAFKMVPSGDIVDFDEMRKRLDKRTSQNN